MYALTDSPERARQVPTRSFRTCSAGGRCRGRAGQSSEKVVLGRGGDPAACEEEVLEGELREVLHLIPVHLSCSRAEVVGVGSDAFRRQNNAPMLLRRNFPPSHPNPHVAGETSRLRDRHQKILQGEEPFLAQRASLAMKTCLKK